MTDNEIIKALEWHLNDETHCSSCPYEEHSVTHFCVEMVIKDALDLINRQQAEIERLTKCRKEEVEKLMSAIDEVITEAKSEAIKEFAEMVEKLKYPNSHEPKGFVIYGEDFDNLVQEMVGEDK